MLRRLTGLMLLCACPAEQQPRSSEPAVAAPVPATAVPVPAAPTPIDVPVAAIDTPAARAAHAVAWAHVRGAGEDPRAIVGDDASPGRFIPIDAPAGALRGFFAALDGAARGPVRVMMYGASGTAADTHTAYVRAYLQQRFGDGGPGLVPLGRATAWTHHAELDIASSKGWTARHTVRSEQGEVLALGPGGLAFDSARRGAWVELRPRAARAQAVGAIDVFALAQPGGGRIRVRVDGGPFTVHATARAEGPALLRIPLAVAPGSHRLRVEVVGDGPVRLFAASFETAAGVVVDTLGVDGARARNGERWDPAIWADGVRARAPALVTVAYGTNEAVDAEPVAIFEQQFDAMLTRVRAAAPQAACVVLGPGDFPERGPAGWQPRPRLLEIVAIERRLAARHGCGFWDELAFMGGPGSMAQWVAATPPLARDDHLHLRPRGSAIKGRHFCDALMLGYDARAVTDAGAR